MNDHESLDNHRLMDKSLYSDDHIIITVIRSALGIASDQVSLCKEDVQRIEIIAKRQSIIPIIIEGLNNLGCSDLLSEEMNIQKAKAVYDYHQRNESLKQIATAFEADAIDFIPLKGAVLRVLYPQPWMRTSNDIDVLVRDSSVERATVSLEKRTGFKKFKMGFHDVHFANEKVHLELHFNLLDDVGLIDDVFALAWNYAKPEENGYCYKFTAEYQMFYIVAHACKHFKGGGGIGIRPLLDIWLLKTRTVFDDDEVCALCDKAGILKFYETCISLLSTWFENKSHTALTRDFEELVLSGGVFGSAHLKILSRKRRKKGVKYALSRLFIKNTRLKGMYPICKKYPILIPLYQMKRWIYLLKPKKQQEVREELKHARSISQADIDRYDGLMKRLGL